MKNLIKDKAFVIGFLVSTILTLLINFQTIVMCHHCLNGVGFPLKFYIWFSGTISFDQSSGEMSSQNFETFNTLNLIVDILFTIILSFIMGLIFKFVWSKLQEKTLK